MSTRDSSASNTTLVNNSLIEIMTGPDNQRKAEQLLSFMLEKGLSFYDEVVTQLDHALQTAELAKKSNANNYLITSALLHDLGHLLLNEKSLAEDLNHEEIGANAMTTFFPSTVTEPIRLHVDAKRYLCTVDQDYYNNLSQASQNSFQVQGQYMSAKEIELFEQNSHFEAAIQIRRWDDLAKIKDLTVSPLKTYQVCVSQSLLSIS
tara:strand:- start:169 stop:786 length:618 start_codon:yes stop_codon:yes gene_type:complete